MTGVKSTGKSKNQGGFAPRNNADVNGWKERLKAAIKEKKTSQRKLGTEAGLGATSMRYIIADAETITLSTALGISNALNIPIKELVTGEKVFIELGSDLDARIAVLGISDRTSDPEKRADGERGIVAVGLRGVATHVHAIEQDDSSMEARGHNEPVPPEFVISKGDIVIWSKDIAPRPGALAIVRERYGSGGAMLSVRKLVLDDDGEFRAVANDTDYGRPVVKGDDVLGGVLMVQRPINQ